MQSTEQQLPMSDGVLVRTTRFEPDGQPLGVVQFVHGFGEHSGMYTPVAKFLTDNGFALVIHDQRGHGHAKALGVAEYDSLLRDITTIRGLIDQWFPGLRVVLGGLSMGGNIVANYAERWPSARYAGVIIESPWLRLAKPMPGAVNALAKVVGKLTPNLAINSGLDIDGVSRDAAEVAKQKADPLYHGRLSFRLYSQLLAAGEYAIAHAGEIRLPTLLLTGTGDRIVSVEAIRAFAANAGANVTLVEFDGAYHALHQDINRAEVLDTMLDFCRRLP